jgi:hypothetical protein
MILTDLRNRMMVHTSLMCWLADLRGHVIAVRIRRTNIFFILNCVVGRILCLGFVPYEQVAKQTKSS